MSAEIEQKVENWKNKLLDLGKQNRLINYRETKRSTLSIKTPEIFALWESFVENSTPLKFPYCSEYQGYSETGYGIDNLTFCEVTTNQNVNELQRTLRNLRNKAKMAIEEQGINILYLSFGFLKWSEIDYSKEQIVSPLLLVPVSLTVESILSPFVLQMTDDEIVVNPALKYKMENDFGLIFPEYDEDLGLEYYLNEVQSAIKNNEWTVVTEVGLGLFSFLKINMYSDLEKNKEKIISNPIVRAIAGATSSIQNIPKELSEYDFDKKEKPVDVFQIVDADSSQQEAILYAKKGVSFVLQGPPGTGKSQTITNIIAECLASGKKVLFVSEKMAALDVVHKRLSSAGLEDFCLVLHSHKANKKSVLEQLRKVLNLARSKAEVNDEVYMKLEALSKDRDKLNQYAEEIFDVVSPLNMSIYQVNGILAKFDNYLDIIFSISNIRDTSYEQYHRYLYVLGVLKDKFGQMSENLDNNPWRGACVQMITNELRHDINARLPVFSSNINRLVSQVDNIFLSLKLTFNYSYENLKKVIDLLAVAKHSPGIPCKWILEADVASLLNDIPLYEEQTIAFSKKVEELQSKYAVFNEQGIYKLKYCTVNDLNNMGEICNEKKRLFKLIKDIPQLFRIHQSGELALIQNERQIAEKQANIINDIKEQILQEFTEDIFKSNYKETIDYYQKNYIYLLSVLQEIYCQGGGFCSELDNLVPKQWLKQEYLIQLSDDIKIYDKKQKLFYQKAAELKKRYDLIDIGEQLILNIDLLITVENLEAELQKLYAIIAEDSVLSAINNNKLLELCRKELSDALQCTERIHSLQNNLFQNFEKEIIFVDYKEMLARYKLQYNSVLKFFRSSYYADRRQMKLLYKNIFQKIDDKIIIKALTTLHNIKETRNIMEDKCTNLMKIFDSSFKFEDTDWQNINMILDKYANLLEAIHLVSEMKQIVQSFELVNHELMKKYGPWYIGITTSWDLVLYALQKTAEFRNKFRKEVALLFKPYYKGTNEPSDFTVINLLMALQQLDAEKEKCNVKCSNLIFVLDSIFEYENTDFKRVDKLFLTYNTFIQAQFILIDMEPIMKELDLQKKLFARTVWLLL